MTRGTGELLKIPAQRVLVASTGVIGVPFPIDKVKSALPKLVKSLSPKGGRLAAEAIMTTDTRPKEAAVRVEVNGRPVTVGGIAKGVGMIEPHMATMFCFLATDAAVSTAALSRLLKSSVNRSLNRITVDGDQSTSDTVAILANGLAENAPRGGSGSSDRPSTPSRSAWRACWRATARAPAS
jgi:glutamate N-acetyltransferase/amino-acid N-acetyltransferase